MIKCTKCGKPQKENTEGNSRYCQGHSIFIPDSDEQLTQDELDFQIAQQELFAD